MAQASRDSNYVPTTLGVSSSDGTTPIPIEVDPVTGRLLVHSTGLHLIPGVDYNYIDVQQTSTTVETYVYKLGGSSGNVVQTIVVTYTDSTKENIDTVEWS